MLILKSPTCWMCTTYTKVRDPMKQCRPHGFSLPCSLCNVDRKLSGKSRGGREARPLTNGYGSTKDQGGKGAKRQTKKGHDTNRRGGRRSR